MRRVGETITTMLFQDITLKRNLVLDVKLENISVSFTTELLKF